jgi:tRNA (guanine10-N2)-dimethyltransferase
MSEISAKINDAIVIASGWQPNIAKIENATLIARDCQPQTIHERVTICDKDSATNIGARSSLVAEILQPASYSAYSDLDTHIESVLKWCESNLSNEGQTLAVRGSRIGVRVEGWSGRTIEQEIGGAMFEVGWKIDLTKPDITLRVIAVSPEDSHTSTPRGGEPALIWGVKSGGTSTWDDRTAPKRPFFKPISLDPRLARSMANIACPVGGNLLDPFCGTGGIILEAAEVGLQAYGSDADSRMVDGSRDNLAWAAESQNMSSNAEVRRCSATTLQDSWGDEAPFNGFAFDPPYGLNSWKSDDGWQLFADALASCAEVAANDARLTALLPWPPIALGVDLVRDASNPDCVTFGKQWVEVIEMINNVGWQIEDTATIQVHKSLARLLLVCQRNPLQ